MQALSDVKGLKMISVYPEIRLKNSFPPKFKALYKLFEMF